MLKVQITIVTPYIGLKYFKYYSDSIGTQFWRGSKNLTILAGT